VLNVKLVSKAIPYHGVTERRPSVGVGLISTVLEPYQNDIPFSLKIISTETLYSMPSSND
jgi:hypothetical protein